MVSKKSSASVTWFGSKFFFETLHRTVRGFWLADDRSLTECSDAAEDRDMGVLLLEALARSELDVAVPDWAHRPKRALLGRSGLRYESQLVKRSKLVQVTRTDWTVELTPTRSEGKGGYVRLADRQVVVQRGGPEELGAALLATMDASEHYYAVSSNTFRRLV